VSPDASSPDSVPLVQLDADGQPQLTLFGLSGRAVPAVYLVGWIASILGVGTLAVSFMGSANPFARWLSVAGLVVLAVGLLAAAGSQAVERSRRPSAPFRGPSPVLAFGAVVAVSLLALLVVVAPLSVLGLDSGGPLGTAISLGVTTLVFVLVVRTLVVRTGALSWSEIGFSRPLPGALADLATGALLAVPVLVVTLLLAALLASILPRAESPLPTATSVGALILNLLSASLLAPLGEEVFFRGYTTTAWARAVGARTAILRGALFFSFAHVATLFSPSFGSGAGAALTEFVALLPAGIALGWVFLARRSIWASLGLHAAFNALQLVLLFAVTARA
jgi:membrane protease YdiL (CAAX protease family)